MLRTGLQTPSGKKLQSGDRIEPGAPAPGYQDCVRIRPEGAEENVVDGVANPVRQKKSPPPPLEKGEGRAAFRLLQLSAWGFIPWLAADDHETLWTGLQTPSG